MVCPEWYTGAMPITPQIAKWIRSNWSVFFLLGSLAFMNIFSLQSLETRPRFWYDEGINVELARNFSSFGKLDVIIAPNTLSGNGALVGSTGYPVTVPLAGVYRAFGFGFAQSRLYMLAWMNIFLIAIYLFSRKRWGSVVATLTTLLFVTYPPFYGNGRSVMGEIPGFFFLLGSLWMYLEKRSNVGIGLLAGLAVISKPSVYIFVLPVYAILYFFRERKHILRSFKYLFWFGVGAFGSLIPWLLLYREQVFTESTWVKIAEHYSNPYATAGVTVFDNIHNNLLSFFTTGTLVYMLFFALVVAAITYVRKEWRIHDHALLLFTLFFTPLALAYYLKSAGYLRYLIAVQFLLVLLITPSVAALIEKSRFYKRIWLVPTALGFLILFQAVYLFTAAKLFYGRGTLEAAEYAQMQFPNATFGTINSPTVASLLPAEQRYSSISTYGLYGFGTDITQLPIEELPDIVFITREDYPEYAAFLDRYYVSLKTVSDGSLILGLQSKNLDGTQ